MIERTVAVFVLLLILGAPFSVVLTFTSDVLLYFVFLYPLFMSTVWMSGGLYFWWRWERKWKWRPFKPPELAGSPLVSIIIPCYNETGNIEQTILSVLAQEYHNIEVIAVNDGSTDATAETLDHMFEQHDELRVMHLAQNQGKAVALCTGVFASRGEFVVCIDGDALLASDAVNYLVAQLIEHPQAGAVTGNPRVRTRSTLVGRVQVGEFASIIGLIKRAQRVYGEIFTVSGVCTAFRKQALQDVCYWDIEMITEDIDITWRLQSANWKCLYEPRALCWVLMPETLRGLWKQRLRWAQGGAEIFLKYLPQIWKRSQMHLWPLLLEYFLSTIWVFALALSIVLWLLGLVVQMPDGMQVYKIMPDSFTGLVLAMACLVQFLISGFIDRRYEKSAMRTMRWIIWYPLAYWMINFLTTIVSFPKVMLRLKRQRARWQSPDRGIQSLTQKDKLR